MDWIAAIGAIACVGVWESWDLNKKVGDLKDEIENLKSELEDIKTQVDK